MLNAVKSTRDQNEIHFANYLEEASQKQIRALRSLASAAAAESGQDPNDEKVTNSIIEIMLPRSSFIAIPLD